MEEKGNGHFTLVRGNITGLINPIKIRQFNFAQEEKGDNSVRECLSDIERQQKKMF